MGNVTNPDQRVPPAVRLDGWKSIAAYLKRDRTTVIRWTRERGLPVHRLPGGQTGTVYALTHELDRWVGLPDATADLAPLSLTTLPPPASSVGPDLPMPKGGGRRWITGLAIAGMAAGLFSMVVTRGDAVAEPSPPAGLALVLPADPSIAAKFLEARDLVADRKAAGLERAIATLREVVRAVPDYPLGHATLAEALLLSREFGMRGDAEAFAEARMAARESVRLAPDLAAGHRMLGFLAYWADRDFAEADRLFKRALVLDPDDAYSHFWYGNVLSDHGNHMAGLRALNQARLLQPGSVPIATDLAWAQWAAGQDAVAKAALDDIIRQHPDFAVAYDCRAIIALSEKDYSGYVHNFAQFAALKQDARLIENARSLETAMRNGPLSVRKEIMRQALAETARDRTRNHVWPALIASVEGDRTLLMSILHTAEGRGERWEDAGLRLHIERTWPHDRQILAALARRKPRADLHT
jgi:tetratricopeptide (TPR) repeat protein